LASLATRQHGVITAAQLAAAGLGRPAIAQRVRRGRLHRVHRGVYAVGHPRLSREGRWMAAVLAAGEGAALCGLSAAEFWQISRHRSEVSEVVAPPRHSPQAGIRCRLCRGLDPRDVVVFNGIRVTTVARTLVGLTDALTVYQVTNVIHGRCTGSASRKRRRAPRWHGRTDVTVSARWRRRSS
jgi:predicted transcriptional regulator of viral defense system